MSTFNKRDLRSTLTFLLKALGTVGIPGGSVAADAVEAAAERLDARQAWHDLQHALAEAEEAFRDDARRRGWGGLADALLQLPIHDLPAFETALRDALAAGNPAALHAELARQFAPLLGEENARAAAELARLYAARALDAAWRVPAFRDAVRDILFREHLAAVQDLAERLERLTRWWELTPALQPRPKSALVVGERRDIPLTALKAPVRLVPFIGRESKRDALKTWAEGLAALPHRAGLRVITGPGGMGKTRLAVETAADLRAAGWEAFFLPPALLRGVGADPTRLNPAAEAWFTPPRPTLYILDYAEQIAPDLLRALLRSLHAAASRRAHPVALLFLMRPAPEPGWVNEVAAVTGADVAFAEFLSRAIAPALQKPLSLQGLASAALPRLFGEARRTFVELRGQAPEREITYDAADLPARPLAVVLLGLLAAYGHKVARSESEQAVLEALWERWEKDKWRRTLRERGLPEGWMPDALRMIETALVAATLGRRFRSPEELAAFWEAHDPPRHPAPDGRALAPRWLAAQMPLLFPAEEGGGLAPAIVPDPLADFVLARRKDLPALARAALPTVEEIRHADRAAVEQAEKTGQPVVVSADNPTLAPLAWPLNLLPLLLRLREAYPRAGQALAKALDDWLGAAAGELHREDPEAAARWLDLWEAALPDHPDRTPVAWREVLAAYYRARLAASAADEADKALWQNNLSVALSALGQRKEALAAAEEAVAIRRRLAVQNPQAYEPYLAGSLNNLANRLSDLGRRKEALAAAEEAAELYRRLAGQNPQAYEPDLAGSLNTLANRLSALGRREEALAAAEEAVELYRRLAAQNPQAYAFYLATSLGTLGSVLLGLNRASEAAEAFAEGLRVLLPHARRLPQAFGPLLQVLLNGHLRAAQAASQPPDEDVVRQALAVGAQGPAPLPSALWAWVEEAARTDQPLDAPIAQLLQAVQQDQNTPPELRTLAARLYAVLEGQRDPEALTTGLPLDEAVNMLVLLAELRRQGSGQLIGSMAAALNGWQQGAAEAGAWLRSVAEANRQAENPVAQAFGRALQALLEGERDPERLLAGWGEEEPLLAALFRLFLGTPKNPA